jgi:hypothetical protein
MVKYPLASGAAVLAGDPLRNVCFTWQAYWREATQSGWSYQGENGYPSGIAGTKLAIQACAASGLCFVIGLDWRDDVGLTGELALMDECHRLGVSYQHWVLTGDGSNAGNNMLGHWNLSMSSLTAEGGQVQAKLLSQRVLPLL